MRAVRNEYFALCAEIDLEADADPVETAARLLFDMGEAIAPPVLNHDLDDLLARGLTLPEILDGPLLERGFIDDAELQATALPSETPPVGPDRRGDGRRRRALGAHIC